MHRPVCAQPFLPLLQTHLRVTVNDPLGTVKTYQGRKCTPQASLSHLPHLCLVFWQRQCMSAPNSSLSFGFFICCSWTSLGYFFLCSCNSDLCLEVPWCLECCQLVSGTGRHTMYFIKSQTLLTFHLLTRLRVSKIMPVNFIIELLDCSDQSQWFVGLDEEHCLLPVIWRTLCESQVRSWLACFLNASSCDVYLTGCLLFLPICVLKYGEQFSNSLLCSRNG